MPASDPSPNRSIWMRQGRACMAARDWPGAIRAYGQGLLDQPPLGMHYAANLERARSHYRQERRAINQQGPAHTQVVVAAAELSHNAAGRVFTLAQLYQHLGHPVALLGSHFPQWGHELWEPIRTAVQKAQLPLHSFVAEHEPRYVEQAFALVLQHPSDLVHLSKPRLPAVVIGLLYKLLWGAAVLVDIDDEELCFVGEREPITLDGLKRLCHGLPEPRELMGPLWTRLAVDLAQRFDGITVANQPLQGRYGGTVIPHARDPEQLRPATADEKRAARQRFGVPQEAKVVLFFGTPRRHKGLLQLAEATAELPEDLKALLVVAGSFAAADADFQQELQERLPAERLMLLGNQPFEQAAQVLALADLVVLLSEGEVAAFQSPAKLSDALAMGLPVLTSKAPPLMPMVEQGWVWAADPEGLARQLRELLAESLALQAQAERARLGFQQTLDTPTVAAPLQSAARQALAHPTPADGRMINALESLHHRISSPLMAYRYRQWSKRRIDWQALQQRERDPELVSIVMPVYGDSEELDGCLQSVRQASCRWRWELIAVMNDDAADSRDVLQRHAQADLRVRAVWPGENTQFALGCNLGFAASRGQQVVFLNNDCRVKANWLDALMEPLADQATAAVQPRLLKPDGTIQSLGVVFRKRKVLGEPLHAGLDGELACCNQEYRLQAVTGACMAVRAAEFVAAQGFDAIFMNSQEDVDLCLRLLRTPGRKWCVSTPHTPVVHFEGVAPGRFRHTQWSQMRFSRGWREDVVPDDPAIYTIDGMATNSSKEAIDVLRVSGCEAGNTSVHQPEIQLRCAVVVHVFYLDLWPEISRHLSSLDINYDLHITCHPELLEDASRIIHADFPLSKIHCFPNEGMDALPFLRLLPTLRCLGYSVVCKLHTKRGTVALGHAWRRHLLDNLIGNTNHVRSTLSWFQEDSTLAIAGPSKLYVSAEITMYQNKQVLERIHEAMFQRSTIPDDWGFFAGSMFWARVDSLIPLALASEQFTNIYKELSDKEKNNSDGSLAHAIERAFGWISRGGKIALLDLCSNDVAHPKERTTRINVIASESWPRYVQRRHLSNILNQ